MGNRRSVEKALIHVGADVFITSNSEDIATADGVILPGVGAFTQAMEKISELKLDTAICNYIDSGKPLLGVCLGMQLLFDSSEEFGGGSGLGAIPGSVKQLDVGTLTLPHIGWNAVTWQDKDSELTAGLHNPCPFYHVHSYAVEPDSQDVVLGTSNYGGEFVSVVQSGKVFGVQFHPEKSSADGLKLLSNFVTVCKKQKT